MARNDEPTRPMTIGDMGQQYYVLWLNIVPYFAFTFWCFSFNMLKLCDF